ncbi:MFS transporter [Dictyobacter arantiisoli]|uniref:MFS transporter n=1 Tax=Dictyobacter arantiisoli TaxID=2014874 RepID=A0A5A5TAC1_9CHLR|nr:MFS transporter [Dictyobacter arantiisoli]GCF08348.1 MFS transporter [Dictyobacter arantiisoli]
MRFRILILALGTFAIGTDSFVIAGVLPDVARSLHISLTLAGSLITLFSLVYAFGAPVLATMLGHVERRRLLLGALVMFVIANVLAAISTSYLVLTIARIIAAGSASLYTPSASLVATMLVPQEKRGQALSTVLGGMTIASVVGVPLGVLIAALLNWRLTFGLVAVLGVVAFVGIFVLFPKVAAPPVVSLRTRLALLGKPEITVMLINVMVWMGGYAVISAYINPFLQHFAHVSEAGISLLLMANGAGSVLGNFLGGYGADHWRPARVVMVGLTAMAVLLFVLPLPIVNSTIWSVAIVMGLWGVFGMMLMPPQQHRLMSAAGGSPIVLSLNSSALFLGFALGGGIGGLVVQSLSLGALSWVSGLIEIVALMILGVSVWLVQRRMQRDERVANKEAAEVIA